VEHVLSSFDLNSFGLRCVGAAAALQWRFNLPAFFLGPKKALPDEEQPFVREEEALLAIGARRFHNSEAGPTHCRVAPAA
jgi:hypothetical protein